MFLVINMIEQNITGGTLMSTDQKNESTLSSEARHNDGKKSGEKVNCCSGKKGWLARFLERLAKANNQNFGNHPPKCH